MNKIDSVSISKDILDYVSENIRNQKMKCCIDDGYETGMMFCIDFIIERTRLDKVDTTDCMLRCCIITVKSMYDRMISHDEMTSGVIIPPHLQKKVSESIAMLETIKDMSDSSYVQEEIASIIEKKGINVRNINCIAFQQYATFVNSVHDILSIWLADLYEGDMDLILDPCDQCDEDCDCHEG